MNTKVEKNYRALVHGPKIETRFVIDQPLRVNGDRHHRTVIDPVSETGENRSNSTETT